MDCNAWLCRLAIVFAMTIVLSALAIYKPVQPHWLAALFGGYDIARAIHPGRLILLAGFTLNHVVPVALHLRSLIAMTTDGKCA